jgi:hypothetical protein
MRMESCEAGRKSEYREQIGRARSAERSARETLNKTGARNEDGVMRSRTKIRISGADRESAKRGAICEGNVK